MTKHTCPRCHGPGIAGIAKRWSARENPAICRLCSGQSHVLASTASGIPVMTFVVLLLGVIAAVGLQVWLWAVPAACLALAYNVWAWSRAELFPIPSDSAAIAKKVGWVVAGLSMLGVIWGG